MIEAFVKAQYKALGAKDNKERLRFMVAGCKDGKLYDLTTDTDYGVFNVDAPDTEFIKESDLKLQRITGAKIGTVTSAMQNFFLEYGDGTEAIANVEPEEVETVDSAEVTPHIDFEDIEAKCKKAIKKGNKEKAEKLLAKLEGQDCHKKLAKKIGKL